MLRNNFKDSSWVGKKFGQLTVLEATTGERSCTYWKCQCDCGTITIKPAGQIYSGHAISCGCAMKKYRHKLSYDENGKITRLYTVWVSMRSRCNRPNDRHYYLYGGRGIKICDEWSEYPVFHEWAIKNGYDENAKRGECTLDRIDVDGDYTPENCRWVNMKIQRGNKRPRKPKFDEEKIKLMIAILQSALDGKTYDEISKEYNVPKQTVYQCINTRVSRITPAV